MQYNAQKKRHEEIDSIRKASAGKGKSEIGIMAQIEDNTNEKFWSSGFTFVAILSFIFGFFTFWFQQKTERHSKNVSISSQLGVLKDLPRHFYRNLVCTVAIIIKYRHKDNRRGEYFKAYPSEANNATHIIGCYKGIVKEVVKITERPKTDHGRKIFIGVEQLDSPYIGLDIRTIFHTLVNFNTKYYNL